MSIIVSALKLNLVCEVSVKTAFRYKGSVLMSSNHRNSLNQIVAFPICLGQTLGGSNFLPPFLMRHIFECICFRCLMQSVTENNNNNNSYSLTTLPLFRALHIGGQPFISSFISLLIMACIMLSVVFHNKTLLISLTRLAFYMICFNVTWA